MHSDSWQESTPSRLCFSCGESVLRGDRFCAACGAAVERTCPSCGARSHPGDRFCPSCGIEQRLADSGGQSAELRSLWSSALRRLRAGLASEYQIKSELGRGGQATVYLAVDRSLLRNVAIKLLAPGTLADAAAVERFLREARTVAQLEHQNIIPIYAVRQVEELYCFVMRYVVGRSLAAIVEDAGQLPIDVVRAISFQVGDALSYAHERGVVHRDVKPANVLIDEHGNAIVTDFGIAKHLTGPRATRTGMLMGTPAYMSPEQCHQAGATWASDQYSLGVVAYEMITGRVPFEGTSLEIMRGHAEQAPLPPRAHRADCPVELESAVLRMLEKQPDERWPSMTTAIAALGAAPLLPHDPIRVVLRELAQVGDTDSRGAPVTPTSPEGSSVPVEEVRTDEEAVKAWPYAGQEGPTGSNDVVPPDLDDAPPMEPMDSPAARLPERWKDAPEDADAVAPMPERHSAGTFAPTTVEEGISRPSARRPNMVARVLGLSAVGVLLVATGVSVMQRIGRREGERNSDLVEKKVSRETLVVDSPVQTDTVLPGAAGDTAVRVRIAGVSKEVVQGDLMTLRAIFTRGAARIQPTDPIVWSSDQPTVVSVDRRTGSAAALGTGSALVGAASGGASGEVVIRVVEPRPTSVRIFGPDRMTEGASGRLQAEVLDQRGRPVAASAIGWTSSNPSVVTVDVEGAISAISAGASSVLASAGEASALHSIVVEAKPAAAAAPVSPLRPSTTSATDSPLAKVGVSPPPVGPRTQTGTATLPEVRSLTRTEATAVGQEIATLIERKDIAAIASRYDPAGDGGRREALLAFLRTQATPDIRSVQLATTPLDASEGLARTRIVLRWRTQFGPRETAIEVLFKSRSEPGPRTFRIGNSPKY